MSARIAGIQGYLLASRSATYLLKQNNLGDIVIDKESVNELIKEAKNNSIIIIGYTYMLWKYFINNPSIAFKEFKINKDSKIIHFGGWKKMNNLKISKEFFTQIISKKLKCSKKSIFDIYGFTEQLGTVYAAQGTSDCRVSSYSHVLIRNVNSLKTVEDGVSGFLQFISILPYSYPGFSIINDDIGVISKRKIDKNKNEIIEFKIEPRLKKAANRGCGDSLPENYYI